MLFDKISLPDDIDARLRDGFDLAVSISGGKDSDAMTRLLVALHAQRHWSGRLILVHADLGRAEHVITPAYIERFVERMQTPCEIIEAPDLVDYMRRRLHKLQADGKDAPHWPSSAARYCTSDTKRGPISKFLRHWSGREGRVICATVLVKMLKCIASMLTWRLRAVIRFNLHAGCLTLNRHS